jgi:hypothetical protein
MPEHVDSSGWARTLWRSGPTTKRKCWLEGEKSPEIRAFSHEKAGREARLSVYCNAASQNAQ